MKLPSLATLLVLQPASVVEGRGICFDKKGINGQIWHDHFGEEYGCSWYGEYWDRCAKEGGTLGTNGLTANEACCVCGGGIVGDVPDGYYFIPEKNSHGNDITRVGNGDLAVEQISEVCSLMEECVAFNRDGWLKYALEDPEEWDYLGPCENYDFLCKEQGMYIKERPNPTRHPTRYPTPYPTLFPIHPTRHPTQHPTRHPTQHPTYPYVVGRPFIDNSGRQLSASADLQDVASWSAACPGHIDIERSNNTGASMTDLGTEWTERALGEHASIASFAAFTVALMSNQAPPKLIADSLVAASDEYRHAQTSFEIASLFLGKSVEPQAIPPSSHEFGYNLSALALGTAEEGCIGETLSAIVAACEVDVGIDEYDGINDDVKALLKDKVRTIVLEETRHAMLAWRTVAWVCSTEKKACDEVFETKFAQQHLDSALLSHLAGEGKEKARSEGEKIFKALVPHMMNEKTDGTIDCAHSLDVESFDSDVAIVEQLSDIIIHGVICS